MTDPNEKILQYLHEAHASEAGLVRVLAIERLASSVADEETARLAASIRTDEERMLQRILREIPKLTEAVVRAGVRGNGPYDLASTGAASKARRARRTTRRPARPTGVSEPAKADVRERAKT